MNKTILISKGVKPLRSCKNCPHGLNEHNASGRCDVSKCSCVKFESRPSAKEYPFWDELIKLLKYEGYETQEITEMPLDQLEALIKNSYTVIAPDSFIQHFCWSIGKQAVVLWGFGDPLIFGHKENINLLKSRSNLRPSQFNMWEEVLPSEHVWVTPSVVVKTVNNLKF